MNERIKELDAQAVEYAVSVCDANGLCHDQEYLQVVKEKFAELIIRECADFVDQNTLEDQGMWGKIMRHFGVEE